MKYSRKLLVTMAFATLLMSSGKLWASETTQNQNTLETPKVVEVGNTICPVSGEKIGTMGEAAHYKYKGKLYNLCCPMCVKDFAKNPEQYSKKAEGTVKIKSNQHSGCGCSKGQNQSCNNCSKGQSCKEEKCY